MNSTTQASASALHHFLGGVFHAFIACLVAMGASAQAMTFTPIEMDFNASGRGATRMFRLENNTSEPAAVELMIKSRSMAMNGQDVLEDAEDQFSIFPAQLVLQPGQVQSVRVQYMGPAAIDKERAFRLIAEQLPIDVGQAPQEGGRMRLLVKYIASIYVVPHNVKAVLSVPEAQIVSEGDQRWLQVKVRNEGGTRKILKNVKLLVGKLNLAGDALSGMEGENVLAQTSRVFRLKLPPELNKLDDLPRLMMD
jgi:fimbrial chaperone protein